jgi:hypothetical protein
MSHFIDWVPPWDCSVDWNVYVTPALALLQTASVHDASLISPASNVPLSKRFCAPATPATRTRANPMVNNLLIILPPCSLRFLIVELAFPMTG